MRSTDTRRWRVLFAAVAAATVLAIILLRAPILRALGHGMVAADAVPDHADAIVVTVDAGAAGLLDASDLVRRGVSDRVAIFSDEPDTADRELMRRGVVRGNPDASWKLRMLEALGAHGEEIADRVNGTEAESEALPRWCRARHYRSIVLVTTTDHSRRVRREVRRTGGGLYIAVRPSPYSTFDAETWWTTRAGLRTGIIELQKLLLDLARHPLS